MDIGHEASPLAFLNAARGLLGSKAVSAGAEIGAEWLSATMPATARPIAIVSIKCAEHAAPLLALAAAHKTPVHPISRGRNWGLGSRLPPVHAVVLDLSGMDKIIDVDMENGTARVEPGVTFAALQDRLSRDGLAWHVPSFGGPTDASVLANALERGEGSGTVGDRFGALWDMDVALTTGERFRTGHARWGRNYISALHPRPAGPLMEGLFSQSAFGVVLSGTIALQPTPGYATIVTAEIGSSERLGPAVGVLRRLISSGLVAPHAISIWDSAKREASRPGGGPIDRLPAGLNWSTTLAISAPHPEMMSLAVKLVSEELGAVADNIAAQSDRDASGRRQASTLTGYSTGLNLLSAYAGMATRPAHPGNLDLDGCGFLWLCPAAPFEAGAINRIAALVQEATEVTPLYPALGFQPTSVRSVHGYVSLAWDRHTTEADADALRVSETLTADFQREGFTPYRFGRHHPMPETIDDWQHVLKRLGDALDPAGVLSPGRLFPKPVS